MFPFDIYFELNALPTSSVNFFSQCSFATHRVMLLEFSQYLENYLWPNYSADATRAHALSIAIMINEKFRERAPAWEVSKIFLTLLFQQP
jgi:Intron-binding protein aquarius N-terminus